MSIAKTFLAILFVAYTMPQSSAHQTTDFVLLNFTAPWCQPCNEMSGAIAQIAEQGWLIRQVDVDREKNLVQRIESQENSALRNSEIAFPGSRKRW
jgi:thiol-disulfide isomerase/thioredoxin